tara:strand:- start:349 stop:723 length:375 start_codon:yes stop_codon:yes gene_type:complete
MALSKKELRDIKNKLKETNPGVVSSIKNRKQIVSMTSDKENVDTNKKFKKQKSVVKWNFGVNDLVEVFISRSPYTSNYKSNVPKEIGLIVSDFIYHTSKVEKNNFFVLVENRVVQLDGKYLRRV